MSIAAFIILAAMIAVYVILDGFDLGVAAITPFIARSESERAASMHAIGPFWNGNEVWLIAAGGALFAFFPKAYASAFSGFYLPFIIVLWMLMFRGIALELRGHFPTRIWHDFWDFCFTVSSTLLILLFGVALGNLLHGVPLDTNGYFLGTFGVLLNPYALGVGILAVLTIALEGAAFIMLRIDGAPAVRAAKLAIPLWWLVLIAYVAVTIATFSMHFSERLAQTAAYGAILPGMLIVLSLAALIAGYFAFIRKAAWFAFLSVCAFLGFLLVAAAATLYPYLLPSFPSGNGISIFDASPSPAALLTALVAVIAGLCITIIYAGTVFPRFFEKGNRLIKP